MSVGIAQSVYRPVERRETRVENHEVGVFRALFYCIAFDAVIVVGLLAGWIVGRL